MAGSIAERILYTIMLVFLEIAKIFVTLDIFWFEMGRFDKIRLDVEVSGI